MLDEGEPEARDAARLELARLGLGEGHELGQALQHAVRISARTLGVNRVGVWLFEGEHHLRSIEQFDTREDHVEAGMLLDLRSIPSYAKALHERRVIAVDDALTDPRTAELVEGYLVPLGIGALLDCPIYRGGSAVGIVCHEHVGGARRWTDRDHDFVVTVADLVGALMEQAARLHTETRLRRSLEALERAHTLEALGRMAAGVAHEFNNLLGALGLQAELLRKRGDLPPEVRGAVQDILDMTREGAALVRQLERFSRDQTQAPSAVDLGELVSGLRPMLEALRSRGVRLALERPEAPVVAWVDRPAVEHALVTLAVDARDAMPRGGTLGITVRATEGAAILEVSDSGETLPAAVLARLFEPFGSPRAQERGSGMALAIAHRTIRQAGGRLTARPRPGGGTLLSMELPLASADGDGPLPRRSLLPAPAESAGGVSPGAHP